MEQTDCWTLRNGGCGQVYRKLTDLPSNQGPDHEVLYRYREEQVCLKCFIGIEKNKYALACGTITMNKLILVDSIKLPAFKDTSF